jgi:glyoxylase I family protein
MASWIQRMSRRRRLFLILDDLAFAVSWAMNSKTNDPQTSHDLRLEFHGVRYQVADVARSVAFYTRTLGFKLEHQHLPQFATVSLDSLKVHLSGPGSSGSRVLTGGVQQKPGGWNRVVLSTADLAACIAVLKKEQVQFRNEMENGPAGKQIQVEDPDGNPIEFFEPAR